jgi:hypothetical protein
MADKTLIDEVSDIYNSTKFATQRSYADVASNTRLHPKCVIGSDLKTLPYLNDVMQTSLNIVTAYYLQALPMVANVGGVNVNKILQRLATTPSANGSLENLHGMTPQEYFSLEARMPRKGNRRTRWKDTSDIITDYDYDAGKTGDPLKDIQLRNTLNKTRDDERSRAHSFRDRRTKNFREDVKFNDYIKDLKTKRKDRADQLRKENIKFNDYQRDIKDKRKDRSKKNSRDEYNDLMTRDKYKQWKKDQKRAGHVNTQNDVKFNQWKEEVKRSDVMFDQQQADRIRQQAREDELFKEGKLDRSTHRKHENVLYQEGIKDRKVKRKRDEVLYKNGLIDRNELKERQSRLDKEASEDRDKHNERLKWKDSQDVKLANRADDEYKYETNKRSQLDKQVLAKGDVQKDFDNSNLAVGKLIDVNLETANGQVSIPVTIRLEAMFAKPNVALTLLSSETVDNTFRERWYKWKAGRIGLMDFAFAGDIIRKKQKLMIDDEHNLLERVNQNKTLNHMDSFLSQDVRLGSFTNVAIVSKDTLTKAEHIHRGKISNYKIKTRMMSDLALMVLVVVDKEDEFISFYYRGIRHGTTLPLKSVQRANKNDGPDIAETLKMFTMGNNVNF